MSFSVDDVEAVGGFKHVARPWVDSRRWRVEEAIHAAAIGAHADHGVLANIFMTVAVLQLATGVALLVQPGRASRRRSVAVDGTTVA